MIVRFKKPVYRAIYEAAKPYLQTRHNDVHTLVSYRFGLVLTKALNADADVVTPAILLHDVGWSAVPEEMHHKAYGPHMTDTTLRDVHEREGAVIAGEILKKLKYDPERRKKITLIVSRHDSGKTADSTEEAIVKDCDKLYRFTKISMEHDAEVFRLSKREYIERIGDRIDTWFLTKKGAQLARAEHAQRMRTINTMK